MQLFIVGAGGLGREIYDTALAAGATVAGFLDDERAGEVVRGLPVLAPEDAQTGASYVVGIADPVARRRLTALLDERGVCAHSVVHPRAILAPESTLGEGCVLLGGAYVSSGVRIGAHSQVQYNATVGHDAVLGERVTVYPGANVSGAVVLEADVTVGSNAVVLQGRRVGAGTFIGAGAVVTRNIGPGVTVVGTPARPLSR